MDKISFARLWDLYHGLLTPTRQEITDLYFNLDLTVSEIAEQKSISRQGVSDCIKACEKQLEEYETKLKFAEISEKADLRATVMTAEVARWAENFKTAHPGFAAEAEELLGIIGEDYSAEAGTVIKTKR